MTLLEKKSFFFVMRAKLHFTLVERFGHCGKLLEINIIHIC